MQREPRVFLWDAQEASGLVARFIEGRSQESYEADDILRSAVERQLTIVGEALAQLSRYFPEIAEGIPELPEVVGFRNILVHGYAVIDSARVWRIATEHLPALASRLVQIHEDLTE